MDKVVEPDEKPRISVPLIPAGLSNGAAVPTTSTTEDFVPRAVLPTTATIGTTSAATTPTIQLDENPLTASGVSLAPNFDASSKEGHQGQIPTILNEHTDFPDDHHQAHPVSPLIKQDSISFLPPANGVSPNVVHDKPRFNLASNAMNAQRSSIYASKSTVTAIPIRNPKSHRLVDEEEGRSSRSRSSSITTSLSKSFLFGFYHDKKKGGKQPSNYLISKEYWMKDESAKECFACGKAFNTFRRKHHCRICGQIFCHSCTLIIDGSKFGYMEKMRVCYHCFEHADTWQDSSDEEDTEDELDVHAHEHLNEDIGHTWEERTQDGNTNSLDDTHSILEQNDNHEIPNSILPADQFTSKSISNKSLFERTLIAKRQREFILLNKDDAQSIMTSGEDSKLFVSTPSPPPKMAIPATRQGESLEISFTANDLDRPRLKDGNIDSYSSHLSKPTQSNERYSIRDVDMIPANYLHRQNRHRKTTSSHSPAPDSNYQRRSMNSLKRSIFNYVGNKTQSSSERSRGLNDESASAIPLRKSTPLSAGQESGDSYMDQSDRVIGNFTNKNFKFQFNFSKENGHKKIERTSSLPKHPLDSSENEEVGNDQDSLEDEGTMSIYSSLNDASKSTNPIRSTRNSSKSFQRAQASLQRIKTRRKSRSKAGTSSLYKDITKLTHSTPNLLSVVTDNGDNSNDYTLSGIEPLTGDNVAVSDSPSSSKTNPVQKLTPDPHQSPTKNLTMKYSTTQFGSDQWRRLSSTFSTRQLRTESFNNGKKNELSDVAILHLEALLHQVLDDQNIGAMEAWTHFLKTITLARLQNIELSARDSNTLDYRQKYVKIKRIPGGRVEQSEYIHGIVFSKALPSKSMPRHIDNPRILLVMFPLEYEKNGKHFLSIESVFAQEKEYLNKLISRLTSLNPDIVYVGANVSGYALELLINANIVVQYNLKPQVIERIARLTEADIVVSIDNLTANVKMGECESFSVKTFVYGNLSKTFTYLRGCDPKLGGSILLRGDTAENLEKIKHVTEFIVYVVFSLKLESSFFNDNFIQISMPFYLERQANMAQLQCTGYFSDFLEKFNNRILTVSPTVEFQIPFLLKKARELEEIILRNEEQNKTLKDEDISIDNLEVKDLHIESTITFKDMKYITKFIRQRNIEELRKEFIRRSRQWEVLYASTHNMLGTGSHQSINVLYSMVSTKTATPCIGPQVVAIDYFWDTDISIGQLIENIVSAAWYPCHQGCKGNLFDHYRSYVHGSGKVDILTEKFQTKLPKLKNIILTWSYCKQCGTSTPILQISEKTWNYSFGKYLEIMFWSKQGSLSDIGNCVHDFTKDHVKYFGYNDLVIRMEYSELEVHELMTPPTKLKWQPSVDIKFKVENYYGILDKINRFYDSIVDRLDRVKIDSIITAKQLSAKIKIDQLKELVYTEKRALCTELEKVYQDYPGDQHLQMNVVIRKVYDKAVSWDSEFDTFERQYLPSETDITRITSSQLRKLFKDTDKEQEKKVHSLDREKLSKSNDVSGIDSNNGSGSKHQDDGSRQCSIRKDGSLQKLELASSLKSSNSLAASKLSTFKVPTKENIPHQDTTVNQNEGDNASGIRTVIHPRNTQLDSRRSSSDHDSTLTVGRGQRDSRVSQLANFFDKIHFDAISKEFELQREFERLRLNKGNVQSYKVQTSTPIVEIYRDVKDAVDEPLHDPAKQAKNPRESTRTLDEFELGKFNDQKLKSGEERQIGTGFMNPEEFIDRRRNGNNKSSIGKEVNKNLESELENSINSWGERVLNSHRQGEEDNDLKIDSKSNRSASSGTLKKQQLSKPTKAIDKDEDDTQPDKSLLMKALANFWADRSGYLWKPLVYPTLPSEHVFADNDVIIRDDEPSSLIAFCLNMPDYKQKMVDMGSIIAQSMNSSTRRNPSQSVSGGDQETNTTLETDGGLPGSLPNPVLPRDQTQSTLPISLDTPEVLEATMTKKTAVHLRYQFQDNMTVMSCKIFFTEHFEAFRKVCNAGDKYVQSLSRCVKWDSSGGKSGSSFLKTLDDRFVIKELSHSELDAFIKFAPSYFEYMTQVMFHELPTALAKVFGFYQIQIKNPNTAKSFKLDVIIMENLFYNKKPTRIFDLKGSMRNRHVEQTGKKNEVLLDENMVEYIYESPIHVREYDKKLLRASLWNDTLFLAKMNVMDYSLVVGIDNENFLLTVGIIDFIRTFTWDKKLESWVKEKGLVGGGGNGGVIKQPTVVTPRQYKNRFREAMERYILMVPDPWYQENT
ncbi:1-phosphatidylinositol-3-phosphate 5-kinase KNAG_0C01990 [Huiozyma naganishii CBS 8797]|uniref:1-phosphatidylinositol-3-phosphate 5-kinase n=1 Tax=Huiozyma naganishii (strain ATCC MYA-139 / BCRC 22969 / CBS 8797 / KCTC 17520 / NBRC 10181 / NCYC 3082 / Yp74L-3) TaxID=1071383 RepID=J7RWD4_HUIN7|nr:hypothetical protein KNAG_0C01990 [Kazachstania naganishii CBS 8797]CCK69312.1 hypothetical protein KNAG_0C01990 [Kazachstania naganishii CBS 8797]